MSEKFLGSMDTHQMGGYGVDYFNDLANHNVAGAPCWWRLYFPVVSLIDNVVGYDARFLSLSGVTVPARTELLGMFTSVDLGSGSVFAYRGKIG